MLNTEQASLQERFPEIKQEIDALFDQADNTHIRDVLRARSDREGDSISSPVQDNGATVVIGFPSGDRSYEVWTEERTGKRFIAGNFPVKFLTADSKVNPRNLLRTRVVKATGAFSQGETRFQPSIGRILPVDENLYALSMFDGSHGAAAELFLDSQEIFCKFYLAGHLSDSEAFNWNNHAHIELRQQEFRAQILVRKRDEALGYKWEEFVKSSLTSKDERTFIQEFLPTLDKRTMQQALVDDVIHYVLFWDQEVEDATGEIQVIRLCKLANYANLGQQARRGGKLLSFELLRSTIFKDFLYRGLYEFDKAAGHADEDPREREKKNLLRLCSSIADHALEGKWGTGDSRCERFWKKGAVRYWSPVLKEAIALHIEVVGSDVDKLFSFNINDTEWADIRQMVAKLYDYEAWDNEHVAQVINSNVLEDTTRALADWALMNDSPILDAYYLAGKERRN